MSKTDPDLDLLRLEAETATTPTRRAWAARLLERINKLEDARSALTDSTTWTTTINPDDPDASNRDPQHPQEVPDDGGGASVVPAN